MVHSKRQPPAGKSDTRNVLYLPPPSPLPPFYLRQAHHQWKEDGGGRAEDGKGSSTVETAHAVVAGGLGHDPLESNLTGPTGLSPCRRTLQRLERSGLARDIQLIPVALCCMPTTDTPAHHYRWPVIVLRPMSADEIQPHPPEPRSTSKCITHSPVARSQARQQQFPFNFLPFLFFAFYFVLEFVP